MKKLFRKIVLILTLAAVICSAAGCSFIGDSTVPSGDSNNLPSSIVKATDVEIKPIESFARVKLDLPDLVDKVERSAVAIYMENSSGSSAGSGVLVDIDDGDSSNDGKEFYIITCHHVISDGGDITVFVPDTDGKDYGDEGYNEDFTFTGNIDNLKSNDGAVALVGGDATADVAVLKIDLTKSRVRAEDLVLAPVPNADYRVREGETVVAIGNPTGELPGTVSVGIVSHLYRIATVEKVGEMSLMQINVDTYQGSSGGGLYNLYGELIGLTNAGDLDNSGINFAIPLKTTDDPLTDRGFVNVATQLVATATENNYGYVTGRWQLGVTIAESTHRDGSSYVYVASVTPNGCSAIAGVKSSDVITGISFKGGEYSVNTVNKFSSVVNSMKKALSIGDKFIFHVQRPTGFGFNISYTSMDIEATVSQLIFCDTGVYPEAPASEQA